MDKRQISQHISKQYNEELEDLREKVLAMGGMVEKQVEDALQSLIDLNVEDAQIIIEKDAQVNMFEVKIDEECTQVLAKRQPAASDLRLIVAIIKTVTDLERIGDEAEKIAKMAVALAEDERTFSPQRNHLNSLNTLGKHVIDMIRLSLDAFARMDVDAAMDVARLELKIDDEYVGLSRQLITYMIEDPRSISSMLDISWAARALERIGDHANNIAEYTIYLVQGKDVRHTSIERMQQIANNKRK
ncbi:MAG: phosphate transport system regulatory protein PhoU [Gammaproteobacteria bacterium CG22_combo_CG10-13_8_21_14_all_40_8]|nr:MAG: phosphate transport system regulatory protein PhoU [Gammaproteobacteria bacterium CG22_combo_CG10-13_8_21_14_all_40_8]